MHERDGAEVIFSSDGTGFGKSYGVIQGYVEYLERFAKAQQPNYLFPEGGFTNLLFMSPQNHKSIWTATRKRKFWPLVASSLRSLRNDIADLDFMDWASGLKTATAIPVGIKMPITTPLSVLRCVHLITGFAD